MPRPHSTDLRQRALPACEQDEDDFTAIARRFRVGVSTLRLWRRQAREEGRRAPRRMGRGPAPLDGGLLALSQLVAERNDATLAECAGLLAARTGKPKRSAPPLSFQRALGSLEPSTALPGAEAAGLGAQAKTPRASEQDRVDVAAGRAAWRDEAAGIDPARLVFLDESGFDTRLSRTHARATGPARARQGARRTLAAAGPGRRLGPGRAVRRHDGRGRDRHRRVPGLRHAGAPPRAQTDAPRRGRGDGQPGRAQGRRRALEAAGIGHRCLPAHSPDMNPIELAWSKLKAHLRARAARSREALERAIPEALATVTASNAQDWFRHAGYPLH